MMTFPSTPSLLFGVHPVRPLNTEWPPGRARVIMSNESYVHVEIHNEEDESLLVFNVLYDGSSDMWAPANLIRKHVWHDGKGDPLCP